MSISHRFPSGFQVSSTLAVPGWRHGYLNRPRLTAERFIPDPFGKRPGERLYRTGDLVRWRSDGNLEYLGRVDRQLKVRGFRIEPAEIEEALQHPAVREAVITACEAASGDRRLVAYLVLAAGRQAPPDLEIRQFLRKSLPQPMIPSAFVVLETLPLTHNGKVDRDRAAGSREFVPPGGCSLRGSQRTARGAGGIDLEYSTGNRPYWLCRQLLRPWRSLTPGDTGHFAPLRNDGRGYSPPCALRVSNRRCDGQANRHGTACREPERERSDQARRP